MEYSDIRNPRWANEEHSVIECEVNFGDLEEDFVPFGASMNDAYEHTKEIFTRCSAGEFGEVAAYVPPPLLEPIPGTSLSIAPQPSGATMSRAELEEKVKQLEAMVTQLVEGQNANIS